MSTNYIKYALLQKSHIFAIHIEIGTWVPVFTLVWIVVQDPTVGVVERSFQSWSWAIFQTMFEHMIGHDYFAGFGPTPQA